MALKKNPKKLLVILLALLGVPLLLTYLSRPSVPANVHHPGQIIYLGFKDPKAGCARCHGKDGRGGKEGPDLRGSIAKHGEKKVRQYILEGKGTGDDAMPGFADRLTKEDVDALIEYLTLWEAVDSLATKSHNLSSEE